jgi:hypothetical protein
MKRSTNRYVQVLLTYIRQTTFWFLAAWLLLLPIFIRGMDHSEKATTKHMKISLFQYFIELVVFLSCWLLPAGWGAILVLHLREQLRNWRNALMPDYRTPHLVIGAILFVLVAAILCLQINWGINQVSLFHSLLMVMTIMIASAWWASFGSQWLSLLLGPWFGLIPIILISIINSYSPDDYYYYYSLTTIQVLEVFINVILPLALVFSLVALGYKLAMMGKRGALFLGRSTDKHRSPQELAESMIQVLLIYLHKPMFRRLLAWPMVFFFIFILLYRFFSYENYYFYYYSDWWRGISNYGHVFSLLLLNLMSAVSLCFILFLPAAWGAALTTHVRKHLEISRKALTPSYRAPELAVAGLVFVFVALLLTLFNAMVAFRQLPWVEEFYFIINGDYFYGFSGALMIVLGTMTVSAWWASFTTQRLALFLGMLTALLLGTMMRTLLPSLFWHSFYYFFGDIWRYQDYWIVNYPFWTRIPEFLPWIFLLLLVLLGFRLARNTRCSKKCMSEFAIKTEPQPQTNKVSWHPATGFWRRAQLRRVSVLGPKAAWLVAGFIAIGLSLFVLPDGDDSLWHNLIINVSFILITVTPSIAAALIWRERWPTLIMEYFYPVRRLTFIHEMATALALDFTELWLVVAAAALVPLTIFCPNVLWDPIFWMGLAASAMMQVLAYGMMALAMSFRSWAILLLALLLALGWMVFPSVDNLQVDSPLAISTTINSSLATLGVGVILALVAYYRWRRMNLA